MRRNLYAKTLLWRNIYIQTQLYFCQKYVVKEMQSVDSSGYEGLFIKQTLETKRTHPKCLIKRVLASVHDAKDIEPESRET